MTEVVTSFDVWIVTNADVRNNPRVRSVKDVLVEMFRADGLALRG